MNITSAHFLPGTNKRLGNRYLLLECLGDGSHGWVWRAERLADAAIVAVKIPKDLTRDDRRLAEGRELLNIEAHPNIVRIHDMGRIPPENEWFFIEMEYFPSQSLAQKLEQRGRNFGNTFERLFGIHDQVLEAVSFLAGLPVPVSHGDIKPHNILIGANDAVKLTDFGSSALPEEIYVRTRENGGTVLYAAPEFSDSVRRSGSFHDLLRGDIYSLGVLLYQLLTGQLPHDTPAQVRRHAPFKRPSEINANIVPAVDALILRCMQRFPADRYPDLDILRADFQVARHKQLTATNQAIFPASPSPAWDWSSEVVQAMAAKDYLKAARIAESEFTRTKDPGALVQQLNALYRARRFFEFEKVFCREYTSDLSTPELQTLRLLAVKTFLELRKIEQARVLLNEARYMDGDSVELDFLLATLLGLEAKYPEARAVLEAINRKTPSKPQVLVRLIQVCEQMRDYSAAAGYLKHALRGEKEIADLAAKRQQYQDLGLL